MRHAFQNAESHYIQRPAGPKAARRNPESRAVDPRLDCASLMLSQALDPNPRPPLPEALPHLRRALTQWAIGTAIFATARLPMDWQRSSVRRTVSFAGSIPVLRRRVLANMRRALG